MLIVNIKELVGIEEQGLLLKRGKEMSETGRIKDAFLLTKGKKIVDYSPMNCVWGGKSSLHAFPYP